MMTLIHGGSTASHPSPRAATLRSLARQTAAILNSGQTEYAAHLLACHHLPPIALGFVATCLIKSGCNDQQVLRLFGG